MRVALAVALLTLCLGCEFRANVSSEPAPPPKPAIWQAPEGFANKPRYPGPYVYVTKAPIKMPDGTEVVCVATLKDLWCRDAR